MKVILAILLVVLLLLAAFADGIYLTGYIIKNESQTPNTETK